MVIRTALDTLIELAQRDTDDAAKRLGLALRGVEDAQQKLQMLLGYRDDYARRFEQALGAGMTPMAYRNFQAFLDKLENAIRGQNEVLNHAQRKSAGEKAAWQECERKRMSYSTLNDRAAQELLKKEAKRDQKSMDEHANRQADYKR